MPHRNLPKGYERAFSAYRPLTFDTHCGEPLSWGYLLIDQLGHARFDKLKEISRTLEYIDGPQSWGYILHRLTRKEALKRYGPVTDEVRGPRGGLRTITFGSTTFRTRGLSKYPTAKEYLASRPDQEKV